MPVIPGLLGCLLALGVSTMGAEEGGRLLRGAPRGELLVIAHRGARSLAPENTLAAARAAWKAGADAWEFDVRLTADGELVILHDDTLVRTTNAKTLFPGRSPWRVDQFTLEEVRSLDAGSWFVQQDPYGTIASGEADPDTARSYRGEKVPTLGEALALTAELGLLANIELKSGTFFLGAADKILVERTVDLVRQLGLEKKVLVSSFNHEMIRHLKKIAPDIAGAFLVFTLPDDPVSYLRAGGVDALNPRLSCYEPTATKKIGLAGFGVYVWTVNEGEEFARLARDPHVTGIITDWPQRLVAFLGRQPRSP